MTPLNELRGLYARYSPERDLGADMGWFLQCGYVFSTPDYIVMGKGIRRGSEVHLILDPTYIFPKDEIDTWFIFAFAGHEKDFLAFIPFELKWIAWQRRGACLRYWTLEHFRQRCETKIPCSIGAWRP